MNTHRIRIVIGFIIILGILYIWNQYYLFEGFYSNSVQLYVISLRHADRLANIERQQRKIGQSITIFNGVKGDFIDIPALVASGILDKKYEKATPHQKRAIGCYLSHVQLLQQITRTSGYTIIFEDDFNIITPTFLDDISNILQTLQKIDFDVLFLGTATNNKGELLANNIYKLNMNEPLLGTYAYLVNNKHIPKIINALKLIDNTAIDLQYQDKGKQNILRILMVQPVLVENQDKQLVSTINDLSIETFF
jgi:GR25 family glycosyltransferase involved in LPS biosynthesis